MCCDFPSAPARARKPAGSLPEVPEMNAARWLLVLAFALAVPVGSPAQDALSVSPEGKRLRSILDGLDVEHHWLPGEHVRWKTGLPDGKPVESGPHTHCSAFVA